MRCVSWVWSCGVVCEIGNSLPVLDALGNVSASVEVTACTRSENERHGARGGRRPAQGEALTSSGIVTTLRDVERVVGCKGDKGLSQESKNGLVGETHFARVCKRCFCDL